MNPLRIVYIGAFRFPTYDAAAARVLNIGRGLRELGHEVTFISWGGKYEKGETDDFAYYDGFKYYISGELNETNTLKKIYNKFISGAKSIQILKSMIDKTDLVISYNPCFDFNLKLAHLCRLRGVKYAVDLTEWYDNNEIKITDILPNRLNMTWFNKTRISNRILISSYFSRIYSKGNNVVIPATCDSKEAKWNVVNARNDNSPKAVTMIYAGTPAKKDKLHEIINAVERVDRECPDRIQLLVLGSTKESYLKNYGHLLQDPEIPDAVDFLGRVPQTEIPRYYAEADFMVLIRDKTRKSEAGFPTKFAESMMSGTPVIANITSDLGKYLLNGKNGFIVDGTSQEELYNTLVRNVLCLSNERIGVMSNLAKKTGMSFFDYRAYSATLKSFIDNLQ